jgi:hypothetical protein
MIVKTIHKPQDKETRKLFNKYGEQLKCVRYHYDLEKMSRFKTVELIVEEIPFHPTASDQEYKSPPPATPYVGLHVELDEKEILDSLREMGGFWSPGDRLWYAPELYVRRIGLHKRIIKRAGH